MKTLQEVFNIVATHLLKQNKRCESPDGWECRYRDDEGNMCAVGCLIPASKYNVSIEGCNVNDENVAAVLQDVGIDIFNDKQMEKLLRDLQYFHDFKPVVRWHTELIDLAGKYNLTTEVLL